ncbi:hypothetical protein ACFL6Z_11520 [Pseudomonadota bacterium]
MDKPDVWLLLMANPARTRPLTGTFELYCSEKSVFKSLRLGSCAALTVKTLAACVKANMLNMVEKLLAILLP